MKYNLVVIVAVTYALLAGACQHSDNGTTTDTPAPKAFIPCSKPQAATAGEQEECRAEEIFLNNYSQQHHERYAGHIVCSANTYNFDGKVLATDDNAYLNAAVGMGLLYPQLVVGYSNTRERLSFSALKEITAVSTAQQRRYSCWLMTPERANATYLYFEFTNEHATPDMEAASFMAGAKLTFFRTGSLII